MCPGQSFWLCSQMLTVLEERDFSLSSSTALAEVHGFSQAGRQGLRLKNVTIDVRAVVRLPRFESSLPLFGCLILGCWILSSIVFPKNANHLVFLIQVSVTQRTYNCLIQTLRSHPRLVNLSLFPHPMNHQIGLFYVTHSEHLNCSET